MYIHALRKRDEGAMFTFTDETVRKAARVQRQSRERGSGAGLPPRPKKKRDSARLIFWRGGMKGSRFTWEKELKEELAATNECNRCKRDARVGE